MNVNNGREDQENQHHHLRSSTTHYERLRASTTNRPYSLIGSLSDPNVRMHLLWESVHYWVNIGGLFTKKENRYRKHILRGVSGEVKPGQVNICLQLWRWSRLWEPLVRGKRLC
jgi:hypothetical protein